MCGIAGFNWSQKDLVKKMTDSIAHRGPDGEGFYVDDRISLGHRRLSIIDLSTKASQPMVYKDLVLTFNGEIYNFRELREELGKKRHVFNSLSDTEVILHAYEEWGSACVSKFNGMWAFGLYDKGRQQLFLSRDRFGEKPLYYFFDGGKFIFSSEVKAIRRHELDLELDSRALNFYFYQKYIGGEMTIFEKIFKLQPAHNLFFHLASKQIKIEKYYDLEDEVKLAGKQSPEDRVVAIKNLLPLAVEQKLIADVPIGSFLSGGLDSSFISALIARQHSNFDTFSIGFKDESYNELPWSLKVSSYLKTSYHFKYAEIGDQLAEQIIENMDEPFGDSSVLPTFLLAQLTREKVTVSLSGDAGDEIFGGYDTYLAHKIARGWPKIFISLGRKLAALLPLSDKKVTLSFKIKRFFENYNDNFIRQHLNWMATFPAADRKKLLTCFVSDEDVLPVREEKNDLTAIQINDFSNYLAEDILKKVDFATMQNALEARVPFLDYRLPPLVLSLPERYKLRGLTAKWLLKDLAKKYLPAEIIRRKKRGFTVPISRWIKESDFIKECLQQDGYYAHGLLNKKYVEILLAEHLSGQKDNARRLWLIFVFNYWYAKNKP